MNKVNIKNKYPFPIVNNLFEQLNGKREIGTKRKHVLVSTSVARRERFVLNWNLRDVL
jgi:hypothetical protein